MSGRILKGRDFKPTLNNISLGHFFFNNAEKHGDKICQIDADLDLQETFKSVKQRSVRLAISLQRKELHSSDLVVFCSYNSLDSAISVIATAFLGAKIAHLDPALSARSTKFLLKLAKPRFVFVDEESLKLIEDSLNETELDPEIIVIGKTANYDTLSDLVVPSEDEKTFRPVKVPDLSDTAVMIFSSGTSGLPKAICHSHNSFLYLMESLHEWGYPVNSLLHYTTFYWISGMSFLTQLFITGGTRIFSRSVEAGGIFKTIEKYNVETVFLAPILTYELTNFEYWHKYDISSFCCLLTGGTTINTNHFKNLTFRFPKLQILFVYGMTEFGICTGFHPVIDKKFISSKFGSAGKALPGATIKIVDLDTNDVVAPYQNGEIRVKTKGAMKGYYLMDSSDCYDTEGFIKSGDVGYYDDDNCVYVINRMKEMFKYLAWHIVPSVIEEVILEHCAVKEVAVFGIPAEEVGEIPAACVVLKENCSVGKEEIERIVEEKLSDKEKLRGGVFFVKNLPRTPTGKLIRNEVIRIVESKNF